MFRLRAELAELRAQNAELRLTCQLLGERTEALVERDQRRAAENAALRERNRLLSEEVAKLRRRVDQNPRNSHRPPSSEGYAKPAPRSRRERTDRQPGGQPGHPGATLGQVATPAERVRHRPEVCAGCGAALAEASVVSTEHRQVFDLPEIALRVVEHALEHRRCGCGRVTMADPPAGVTAPAQYGPGVRALATYLLAGQHLPLARTGELLAELIGAPVSQGSLAGWYADAAAALEPVLVVVTTGLAGAEVIGADETGIRLDGGRTPDPKAAARGRGTTTTGRPNRATVARRGGRSPRSFRTRRSGGRPRSGRCRNPLYSGSGNPDLE